MTSTIAGKVTLFASLIAVLACSTAMAADQPPDVRGKWVGKTHSIVAGSGGHWPASKGTFDKPALAEKDLVIEITGQEGRRFWGNQTFSGNGESTQEPMIGELTGKDFKTVVIVDTDGYLNGQIGDNDVLSFCCTQAGGKTQSSVVSCSEVKRTR
jgi:hypothetical protein